MSKKSYLCPYCNKRFHRDAMIGHIDRMHEEQLPKGFTPLQMTFHIANNRPVDYRRKCRVCGKPTEWDENKGRYNFLCSNPRCKDLWVKNMKNNMGDKFGAYRPTATPEGLKKMLASRKISGKYKWSDGVIFDYTGSYELATLKFFDKVLNVKSEDIECPGPVINYNFKGKNHLYITDLYYRPYNLVIEVKDGGDNPRGGANIALTREKQMAKEQHIIKNTDFNYLRLTDKDFSQVLSVFADLKLHLVENDKSRTIHVNENSAIAGITPMVGFKSGDAVIVNYLKHNTFVDEKDYAICDSPKFDTVFARNENGVLEQFDATFFENCDYTPYIIRNGKYICEDALSENLNKKIPEKFLYEVMFGHPCLTDDQIMFESSAEEYKDFYQEISDIEHQIDSYIGYYPEPIKEGFLFSEKDLAYNYDEFRKGKVNILFITGHSGAGKSTMARRLADVAKADYVDLDDIISPELFSDEGLKDYGQVVYDFFTKDKTGIKYRHGNLDSIKSGSEQYDYLLDLASAFIRFAIKSGKRLIIEGIELFILLDASKLTYDELLNYGVIVMGTSGIKSSKRAVDRDNQSIKVSIKTRLAQIIKRIHFAIQAEFSLKKLRKVLSEESDFMDFDKEFLTEKAVAGYDYTETIERRWGIYADDESYNCCVMVKGYLKPMRGRTSLIVLKEENGKYYAFLRHNTIDHEYNAPGGGWNPDEDPKDAGIRETQEEVHINTKEVMHCGCRIEYYDEVRDWVKTHVKNEKDWWYGYYTEIYVGMYDGKYTGEVDAQDRDPIELTAKFYPVDQLDLNDLYPEYKAAIDQYIRYHTAHLI